MLRLHAASLDDATRGAPGVSARLLSPASTGKLQSRLAINPCANNSTASGDVKRARLPSVASGFPRPPLGGGGRPSGNDGASRRAPWLSLALD